MGKERKREGRVFLRMLYGSWGLRGRGWGPWGCWQDCIGTGHLCNKKLRKVESYNLFIWLKSKGLHRRGNLFLPKKKRGFNRICVKYSNFFCTFYPFVSNYEFKKIETLFLFKLILQHSYLILKFLEVEFIFEILKHQNYYIYLEIEIELAYNYFANSIGESC